MILVTKFVVSAPSGSLAYLAGTIQSADTANVFWSATSAIATVLLAIATALLVVATMLLAVTAIVSAVIAYRLYRSGVEDKRVDRTIEILNRFSEQSGQAMSPEEAYRFLNETHQGTTDRLKGLTRRDGLFQDTLNALTILHNYYERVRTLNRQHLIEMDIFFREQGLVLSNVSIVTGYLREWFVNVTGVTYTTIAVDALLLEREDSQKYGRA
jgi:lysylphosphatidylglycerol synthetase-like protein (DUF2156 family)